MSSTRMMAWTIWIIASIFYAYQYILRVMPNIMMPEIMEQFGIGAAAFGQFSGIYYIGYSLMHLPLGIMLDRFGPRKVMSASILLTVVGLLPLIFSDYWVYPIVGRLLIGAGSSAAILGIFKIVRMMFSEARFARMLSLSVTIGLMGAIYGGGPVSYMRDTMGYEPVLHIFALGGIILAAVTYWIVPDLTTPSEGSVLENIREVLFNKRVMGTCIFAGLMVAPLEGFADVWGTVFFKQVYGFDGTVAASLPSMIFIGMCFGAPVLSIIAEKAGSYLAVILGAGIMMAASFTAMLYFPLSSGVISLLLILIGISCSYQILAIYQASTYVREQVAGLTTAVANMIIMIFGYFFHSIIGGVVNVYGGPESSKALILGVEVIPIGLALGVLGFVWLLLANKQVSKQVVA